MKNNPTVVSFNTPGYELILEEHLAKSMDCHPDLKWLQFKINDQGDWLYNTQKKVEVLLKALETEEEILYVDVDAQVLCDTFEELVDAVPDGYIGGCVFLKHSDWYKNDSDKVEPLTGTLYLRRSAIPMLKEWQSKLAHGPDGDAFGIVVGNHKMFPLDIKWCYINSLPTSGYGGIECSEPEIVHYQASRGKHYA